MTFTLTIIREKSDNVYLYTFLLSSMMNQWYITWNHRGSPVSLNIFEDINVVLGQVNLKYCIIH
jgi:hypothetical protein